MANLKLDAKSIVASYHQDEGFFDFESSDENPKIRLQSPTNYSESNTATEIHSINLLENERPVPSFGVRAQVTKVSHGTFFSSPATLIVFSFNLHCEDKNVRFKKANFKITFSKHSTAASTDLEPEVVKLAPRKIFGHQSIQGGKIKRIVEELTCWVPRSTHLKWSTLNEEREAEYGTSNRDSIVGNFWSSDPGARWDIAYWDVREDKRTKDGIPNKLDVAVIVGVSGPFLAVVEVLVDTPIASGILACPWKKDSPALFVPGVQMGKQPRTNKFDELTTEEWKALISVADIERNNESSDTAAHEKHGGVSVQTSVLGDGSAEPLVGMVDDVGDESSKVGNHPKLPTEQMHSDGVFKWFQDAIGRSLRPPISSGSQRIEWICECGELLYMDFGNNSEGSFAMLDALPNVQSVTSRPSAIAHTSDQSLPGTANIPIQALSRGPVSQNVMAQQGSTYGSHPANTPQKSLGASNTVLPEPVSTGLIFLELCVNTGRLLKSLGEVDVSSISTDGDFFATVKEYYLRLRGFRARFWLLKPVTVSYVRFSVEDRCRVGILHKPVALPPKSEVDAKRYLYNPCPLENELPISSDLFLHYLFSCSSPSRNLIWLPRIPRKLDTSILASPTPASFGWGIHIDEGPDYLKIFILNFAVLGLSGAGALLWSLFKHDFQGAMGLAAWIIMLLNTLMAISVAKWSQE
ncbi:hypothetical protein VTL71DRAFT_3517 [Oculimacula yallundae]|uniref:Uncharacterized protein n=1 Tax=Oculimacula yallundae TaxID=86028 RepID=A0ABR4C863_9HELO